MTIDSRQLGVASLDDNLQQRMVHFFDQVASHHA